MYKRPLEDIHIDINSHPLYHTNRQVYGGFVSFLVVDRHKKCGLSPAHPKHSRPSFEGLHNACAGRALEWHSRGQRFDPAYLHQESSGKSEGKGFKSKDLRLFSYYLL